ncbi:MAG: VWA domain-containing protein [Acidobacteriota bacterium]|nr:VWA domain-containing protein [Acidobacteriota bacterium]
MPEAGVSVTASTMTPNQTVHARAMRTRVGEDADEDEVVRINYNLVAVRASVVDDQGKAITDLKPEDFELQVDGQPKPIGDLSRSATPVRMAVLFDNSSSVTPERGFQMQAAIQFLKSVLRPIDQAAIYSVSTVPELVRPLTSDVQTLVRTVESFAKPEGATALFDAIAQAAVYLSPHPGRKVIVIVSDGVDTVSDLNFNTTLRRMQSADCQFYAVQTGYVETANLRELVAERRLQEFGAHTGGAVYVPKTTADLDMAFAQISADLAQQYVLSYYPRDGHRDGRFHAITIRVKTRPHARVRARRGYYAPKS